MKLYLLLLPFVLALPLFAQTNSELPQGFSIDNINKSVNPCVDFYQYSCGNWLKKAEIPPDQSGWDSFVDLHERNEAIMRGILEKVSGDDPARDPINQKIGDFYSSCMDEKTVNAKGIEALKPELDRVAEVKDKAALIDVIAHDHLIGTNSFFDFGSSPDLHNAGMDIANLDQSGLTLPDRDYYISDTPKMVEMRKHLLDYATQIFTLDGQSPQQASDSAHIVLRIETALANAEMDRTLRRDPKNRDHKMERDQIRTLAPNLYLNQYFEDVGSPNFNSLNVRNPEFFQKLNGILDSESLDALKIYASWHLLSMSAPWLSEPFVQANFQYRHNLTGQAEIQPRWKRCVSATDNALGEALGQRYVELTFGADGKQRMLKMVMALEEALGEDIDGVTWMSPETKKQAHIKLAAINNKIGYPDKWRDYAKLTIARGDLIGNFLRANDFESKREVDKIEKPVDKNEWGMTPPTVNAYYNPSLNEIVFPAGILQPPFFDKEMDDAINFGGIGLVIGHELTHGFDDQGRKYDPQGNLRDWWTPEDGKEFEKRASCVANEYGGFVAVDDLKLNGKLTLGENTADNGGARISLMALHKEIAQDPTSKAAQKIDGYTSDQRFFLGFGRVWCQKQRPEYQRMLVSVDPHSPGKYRVNGVLENMPEFEQAWSCKAGQPMVSANACRVW
ncbi:MAG TPA: M13 family metallopeptidase [Terriglobales bacterium]|nr:M13 family metallopeptidase [Terriglobales bacterium]